LPLAIHVRRRTHVASAPPVHLPRLAPLPLHPCELLEELLVVGGVERGARQLPSLAPPLAAHPGLAAQGEDLEPRIIGHDGPHTARALEEVACARERVLLEGLVALEPIFRRVLLRHPRSVEIEYVEAGGGEDRSQLAQLVAAPCREDDRAFGRLAAHRASTAACFSRSSRIPPVARSRSRSSVARS